MSKTKANISATIDIDVLKKAKAKADKEGRSLSNYVEKALKDRNKGAAK